MSDPSEATDGGGVQTLEKSDNLSPAKEISSIGASSQETTDQGRKMSQDQSTSPSTTSSSMNTSSNSSGWSSGGISPLLQNKSSDQSTSGTPPTPASAGSKEVGGDSVRKSSKTQGRRSSDIARSMQSKSPKKNESVRKKISAKEEKVLLTNLDDTLDTMIGFTNEVHSSTLTSSTGVEGLDISPTSAIKPKVSSLPSSPIQDKTCTQSQAESGGVQNSSPSVSVQGRSPPSTSRTSPITTPNLSFKRQQSGKSLGHVSEFSVASSTNSIEKRSKRKSWINNTLNPTYNSKYDDLRKNFPGLPFTELLLGDYSCALQKDILVHGRMYVTTNFLCFYANLWKWETAVSLKWKDVSAMTKEKTALVIPNAIQICTGNDKLFFCSFTVRDKAHMTLFKVWQNALMEGAASESELLTWAQSQYGDRPSSSGGKTSDLEYDASNDGGSNQSFDGLEPQPRGRAYSNIEEENEENKLAINEGSFLPDAIGDKPLRAMSRKSESLPTDMSDNSESETQMKPELSAPSPRPGIVSTDILTYEAWRQSKVAKEVLNQNFTMNIDDLFTLLFTNSKFFYDFQAERKTFDIVQCPWQQSQTSDEKFRKVEFTLNLNHAMGPRTSRATEVQTMRANSVPGHIYNVDVETTNADIPYAEYFSVLTHYCIVKVNENESRLTVLCDIKYKKSPWGIIKSFIDKNVWAGIDEHFTALSASLEREVAAMMMKLIPKEPITTSAIKKKTRKQRARKISITESAGGLSVSGNSKFVALRPPLSPYIYPEQISSQGAGGFWAGGMNTILLVFLIMFCFLNLVLLYKFWSLELQVVNKIDLYDKYHINDFQGSTELPQTNHDWLSLIRKQELKHAQDLEAWQQAVKSAALLLKQTEKAMSVFSRSFQADTNRKLLKHFLHQQAVEEQQHQHDVEEHQHQHNVEEQQQHRVKEQQLEADAEKHHRKKSVKKHLQSSFAEQPHAVKEHQHDGKEEHRQFQPEIGEQHKNLENELDHTDKKQPHSHAYSSVEL